MRLKRLEDRVLRMLTGGEEGSGWSDSEICWGGTGGTTGEGERANLDLDRCRTREGGRGVGGWD